MQYYFSSGVCSALDLENIDISCYEGDIKIRCNKLLLSGTIVRPECKPHFIKESLVPYGEIECNENGQWNHLLFKCNPGKNLSLQTSLLGKVTLQSKH